MAIRIEVPEGNDALTEFILFHDQVYETRRARWSAFVGVQLPILTGESAYAKGRKLRPLVARDGSRIVARAVAAVDDHYIRHWKEDLGHILWFEATPDAGEASRQLLDEACEWLASEGMKAARAGMGLFEFPFTIDAYERLPPAGVRQNPIYYHGYLKNARFESEKGWVDYKIEVRPELVARYESALEAVKRSGYEIVPLRDVPPSRRLAEFTDTWNDAFQAHWGAAPFTEAEFATIIEFLGPAGMLETSVLAYRDGKPEGVLWVTPEFTVGAIVAPGSELDESEKLNFLGIGVRRSSRGRGVNLGMAAYAYLELVRRGAKWLSYTMVLDDNWPSRRTAEKLGASVCASYLVYRRNL
jgi:hypothetical protein